MSEENKTKVCEHCREYTIPATVQADEIHRLLTELVEIGKYQNAQVGLLPDMYKQVREMHLFITGVKAALLANPMVRAMVPADVLKELSGE